MQWHDTFLFTIKREGEREREAKKDREGGALLLKVRANIFHVYFFLIARCVYFSFLWILTGNNLTKWIGQEAGEKDCQVREKRVKREWGGNLNAIVQQQQISCGTLRQTVKMKTGFYTVFAADKTNSSDRPPAPLQCACTALNKSIYKYWQFIRAGAWLAGGSGVNLYAYL